MRLIFFSLHGGDATEMAILCQRARVELDIAGSRNRLVRALTRPEEQTRLQRFGVGAPDDEEILDLVNQRRYDAVVVSHPQQILQVRERIQPLQPRLPLLVHHSTDHLADFRALGVQNFFSPSPMAIKAMKRCNTLLCRKLLDFDAMPAGDVPAEHRHLFHSYIHDYAKRWPGALARFEALNRYLAPRAVINHGLNSPHGEVDDVAVMSRSRATVQIKDSGVRCFSVLRSMAMSTPVVMDRATFERCGFFGFQGLLVRSGVPQMALVLHRLADDDQYWARASESTRLAVRQQCGWTDALGQSFHRFLANARPPARTSVSVSRDPPRTRSPAITGSGESIVSSLIAVHERLMQPLFLVHDCLRRGREKPH